MTKINTRIVKEISKNEKDLRENYFLMIAAPKEVKAPVKPQMAGK